MSTTPDTPPVTPAPAPAPAGEDRTVAIVSYLTIFGFIIALIMHGNKKTALGTFHLRQCLGLIVASLVAWIAMMIIGFIPVVNLLLLVVGPVVWIGFFVLWIIGLIAAINGQQKPVPLLGEHFQKWFAGAFN